MSAPASRWRTQLDELRLRVRNQQLASTLFYDDTKLLATVNDAEDFVAAGSINPVTWNTAAKDSYDAAVRAMVDHFVSNPNMTIRSKDGELETQYDNEVPMLVRMFWKNFCLATMPDEKTRRLFIGKLRQARTI